MTNDINADRSSEACPVCGQHTLHLLYFPEVDVTGARQYDDILGFGDIKPDDPPGIGCDNCGSDWPSLDEFRAAQQGASDEKREAD
jgi:hypothetical protein